MTEADFYEHLVEVRRESEIELAKTITRKNAELKALQEETECKHREMKQSVDMLERQLAAAIENADQVRRQCEEQSKQMQASINAQLEKLFQENAEQSEHLDQKHAEEIHQLKTAHDSDLLRLKEQTATVEKLRADLNEQARHVKQMEILCAELTEERNNALEQRQLMEHELNERTERIVEVQNELNETSLKLRNLEMEHDRCLRQQTEAIMHMQHETVKQMSKTQQNCTDALNALNTMIGQLTAEKLHCTLVEQEKGQTNSNDRIAQGNSMKVCEDEDPYERASREFQRSSTVNTNNAKTQTDGFAALQLNEETTNYIQTKSFELLIEKLKEDQRVCLEAAFSEKEASLIRKHEAELSQVNPIIFFACEPVASQNRKEIPELSTKIILRITENELNL
ncbi:unnamed protein product [Dicrocoelium dendriticum]|nr:unnamed protein product [Dicrocoelium dendriticum]